MQKFCSVLFLRIRTGPVRGPVQKLLVGRCSLHFHSLCHSCYCFCSLLSIINRMRCPCRRLTTQSHKGGSHRHRALHLSPHASNAHHTDHAIPMSDMWPGCGHVAQLIAGCQFLLAPPSPRSLLRPLFGHPASDLCRQRCHFIPVVSARAALVRGKSTRASFD